MCQMDVGFHGNWHEWIWVTVNHVSFVSLRKHFFFMSYSTVSIVCCTNSTRQMPQSLATYAFNAQSLPFDSFITPSPTHARLTVFTGLASLTIFQCFWDHKQFMYLHLICQILSCPILLSISHQATPINFVFWCCICLHLFCSVERFMWFTLHWVGFLKGAI